MSEKLFRKAKKHIPGGVNSPVRAFKSVSGIPVFIKNAKGSCMYDMENRKYLDYVGSWGPMILGHAHPEVIHAVQLAIENGLSFGAPTEIETSMAEKICELVPSIEKVRMVNSGTEAAMSAIRLARGYTGRNKIIKFEGCYHGHADSMLVKAGSGALTLGVPTSPGVPDELARLTITLDFNNTDTIEPVFNKIGDQIAAIIVEPVAGNMNCVPGTGEFLQTLRDICNRYGCLLIFDEVMSGFRVALGGAQSIYNIIPDLTILGKVIGGGMPVGAFGGQAEIMDRLAPDGPVYQAGTLSGNPVAMTAGLTTLNLVSRPRFYDELERKTINLVDGLKEKAEASNIPFTSHHVGGMFGLFFSEDQVITSYEQVMRCNRKHFESFFKGMLNRGIYLAPSPFEAGFVSSAHTEDEIQETIDAAENTFQEM